MTPEQETRPTVDNHQLFELLLDVRERVVAVETKLTHIERSGTAKALEAYTLASEASDDIASIKETQKWTTRTIATAVIGVVVQIFFSPLP